MTNISSYSKKVLQYFRNPHNYGRMKSPTATGTVGNIVCGDVMKLYLKIGKNKKGEEVVQNAKFETFGCAAAIATSSVITDLVKGKTVKEALKINKDDVIKTLHGLPPIKIHCSLLAVDALSEAIYEYFATQKHRKIPETLKKIHEKNKKEREMVEERHGEWTKAEKGESGG